MAPDGFGGRLADDVLPPEIEELAVPADLDRIFPWHRPRKQLIREEQWMRYSRHLIEREKGRAWLPQPFERRSGSSVPDASRN